MSINHLYDDIEKPDVNIRVYTLKVDHGVIFNDLDPSLPVQTDADGKLVSLAINLADNTRVSGILPISNGGTNSTTALVNSKLMVSDSGSIIEGTSSSIPSFSSLQLLSNSNQILLGSSKNTILSASNSLVQTIYEIPDIGSSTQFTMCDGDQTISGNKTFIGDIKLSSLAASSLLSLDASKIITTSGTPTLSTLSLSSTSNEIQFIGNSPFTTSLNVNVSNSANRIITIPDPGLDCSTVMSEGTQIINGNKTFNTLSISSLANEINFIGIAPYTTSLNVGVSNSADTVLSIPNPGTNCSIVITETAQTINGVKTLNDGIILPASGGTPTLLNYYEVNISTLLTFTGIWASNQSSTASFCRIGKLCNMVIPTIAATSNTSSVISLVGTLSSRFRPSEDLYFIISIEDNNVFKSGIFWLKQDGDIEVRLDNNGNFAGSGSSGFQSLSISYITA
jgi:hypothetical protein